MRRILSETPWYTKYQFFQRCDKHMLDCSPLPSVLRFRTSQLGLQQASRFGPRTASQIKPMISLCKIMDENSACASQQHKNKSKTYNSGDSPVVTHLTTNPPVSCLSTAERTGSADYQDPMVVCGMNTVCIVYFVIVNTLNKLDEHD
jgi:hypothetical protein